MSGIEVGRVNVAARGAGLARAALDDALRYAQQREAFGKRIAHHQAVQLMLAKMAARALLPRRAAAPDRRGLERDPATRDRAPPARALPRLTVEFTVPTELKEIRTAVRTLCESFPGEYWRELEPDRYPEEFVATLTE